MRHAPDAPSQSRLGSEFSSRDGSEVPACGTDQAGREPPVIIDSSTHRQFPDGAPAVGSRDDGPVLPTPRKRPEATISPSRLPVARAGSDEATHAGHRASNAMGCRRAHTDVTAR